MIPAVRADQLDRLANELDMDAMGIFANGGAPLEAKWPGGIQKLDQLTPAVLDADRDAFRRAAQKLRTIYA